MEIRLSDQIRRFSPVEVDSSSGAFSYDGLDGVQFNVREYRFWIVLIVTGTVFAVERARLVLYDF